MYEGQEKRRRGEEQKRRRGEEEKRRRAEEQKRKGRREEEVSYADLRVKETVLDLVCRLLLEKKKIFVDKDLVETVLHKMCSCDIVVCT